MPRYRANIVIEFDHPDTLPTADIKGQMTQVKDFVTEAVDNIITNHNPPDEDNVHIEASLTLIPG